MSKEITKIAVLIPAYEPDDRLPVYVKELRQNGFQRILVVDDGSGDAYRPVFDAIDSETVILRHEQNKGKGAGLKTGFTYIDEEWKDVEGILTADSDGQHAVKDCIKLAEELSDKKRALYLGCRDFNLPNIPPKSRSGNKITSFIFKALYGQKLPDTQTGLRAFGRDLIPFMLDIKGDRFEYETNMLIACIRKGVAIENIPIETIYEDNNSGTHFNPVLDSIKIYKVILGSFFKFMFVSLFSALLDQVLFNVINIGVFSNRKRKKGSFILISTIIARVFSSIVNYSMNRNLVFGNKENIKKTFIRYFILCVTVMLLSALGTWALSIMGLSSTVAKLIVDTVLYFLSYRAQERWVFAE